MFFEIHDEGDNRLKNKNAKRRVPVHSIVMQCGFGEMVGAAYSTKNKRLFADVNRAKGIDTSYRKNFTRTYSRYLKRYGVHNPLTTFHSLRRNFTVSGTNARIPRDIMNAICGWKLQGGQGGTYLKNRDFQIALLSEELEKISYPFLDEWLSRHKH